jgi:asparagine synthase (glutamine-hydrolysing)
MIIDRSGKRLERYWTLERDRISGLRDASYAEAVTAVREALEDSVAHQMIADVPVGAFLSGGIDSGLLVALMARQSAGHLKTFSVGFGAEGSEIDESDDADLVARYLGTDHQRLEITGKDMLASIGEIGRALDQPSVDGVNSFFVSKAASRDVKVSISGTGGDELFAGYPWFSVMQNASIPPAFGPIAKLSRKFPVPRGRIRNIIDNLGNRDFLGKFSCQHRIFSTQQTERLLDSNLRHFASGLHHAELLRNGDELSYGDRLERVSALCLRGYTQNQLLRDIDAVSMHHSLEVRVPFLDTLVADTAFSVAENVKIHPFQDERAIPGGYRATGVKRVLLDVGRNLLPEAFDNRPKRGFGMPFDRWLGAELNEVMRDCLSQSVIKNRGLFDPAAITNLVDLYEKGEVPWAHVWVPLVTELWCQQVLDITAS